MLSTTHLECKKGTRRFIDLQTLTGAAKTNYSKIGNLLNLFLYGNNIDLHFKPNVS